MSTADDERLGRIEHHLMAIMSWSADIQKNAVVHLYDLRDLKVGYGPRIERALKAIHVSQIPLEEARQALVKLYEPHISAVPNLGSEG